MARLDWIIRKLEATGRRGMIATKHPMATAAGLRMLERGGNAVDAAVAAAFCSGVVEPMMSGLGGGGFMVVAAPGGTLVVDYSLQTPLAASSDLYELTEGTVEDMSWSWRRVRDDANLHGPLSAMVPGAVPGLALAARRFGRLNLATLLEPAIAAAEDGFPIDWQTCLRIAAEAQTLRRYPAAAAVFLEDGLAPAPARQEKPRFLKQPDLGRTLRLLATEGPESFRTGAIARRIVGEVRAAGGILSDEDFEGYKPTIVEPLTLSYRGWSVATVQGGNGGPVLASILTRLNSVDLAAAGHNTVAAIEAFVRAAGPVFAQRYAAAPLAALDESTTHLSAADGDGMLVSLTQTLLGGFGSRFLVPGTGIVLNNGMFWLDPEPNRPMSIRPGQRAPANMAPVILSGPEGASYALGSSGGRRIVCCNAQIILNLVDFRMGLQTAIEAPRFDCSGETLLLDDRIDAEVVEGLRSRGHNVAVAEVSIYPTHFASPTAAGHDVGFGILIGAADPFQTALAQGI